MGSKGNDQCLRLTLLLEHLCIDTKAECHSLEVQFYPAEK